MRKIVKGEMPSRLYRLILPGTLLLLSIVIISSPGKLFAEISDGANGGNEHFFFLPPLVPKPSPTGTFADSLAPVVQICEWTGTECVLPPITEFTTTSGPGSDRVRVVPEDEHYIVNWHPKGLDSTKTYRIRVLFRIEEGVPVEKELGHVDVTVSNKTIPIKFRIEEGVFPIGELTPMERAKISPILLRVFISDDMLEPVEVFVNVLNHYISMPELSSIEIIEDYRPTLAKVFVKISNAEVLATLAQSSNVWRLHENKRYVLFSYDCTPEEIYWNWNNWWKENIGLGKVQQAGYIGAGTVVAVVDDGGKEARYKSLGCDVSLPEGHGIDLGIFPECTDVGTPACCSVVVDINEKHNIGNNLDNHMSFVAKKLALTAPGTDLVGYDIFAAHDIDDVGFNRALKWIVENHDKYNIVALNMSFGTPYDATDPWGGHHRGHYSTQNCPPDSDGDFQRLRQLGIMPIAATGNDGGAQFIHNDFTGIGHPACSPFVVAVSSSTMKEDQMLIFWRQVKRELHWQRQLCLGFGPFSGLRCLILVWKQRWNC